MARANELLNNRRTDKAGSTCYENAHRSFSLTLFHDDDRIRSRLLCLMSTIGEA